MYKTGGDRTIGWVLALALAFSNVWAVAAEEREAKSQGPAKIGSPTFDSPPSASQPQPPLTLEALEQLAVSHNPTLVQAQAVIDAAQGRQIQAGLYPNPSVGYTGTEIGDVGRAGQQGIFFSQEIVRGGKLRFSSAVAAHELEQAEARAEAQRFRVLNGVRTVYYNTLAAERIVAQTKELRELAEKAAHIAEELLRGGQGTRTDVLQAEIELEQVRILEENAANNYQATWRRLAAVVGVPDMQPAPLEGDLEERITDLTSEEALTRILARSPEIVVADAGVRRAKEALCRARVQAIPNVTLEVSTQYDYASRDPIVGVGLSLPLPIFNRNQGNILAAEAEVLRATRDVDRVRLALTERFAAAFARYENAHQQVAKYRERILPKAQESLNLISEGYRRGEFSFLQVLTAQRTLAQVSISYLEALGELHTSVVEIEGLLLIDGLNGEAPRPLDDLEGGEH